MDEILKKTVESVREYDISGIVCNDSNGLCFAAQPPEEAIYSGAYESIMRKATALSPQDMNSPIVLIESEKRDIMIREYDGVVITALINRNSAV
mmetsp:Transcript_12293/g.18416  ORF Transcript_12293/g.18416 Transcript_12293/m.18416 type:complete len:94 (-) Transcript_12293:23-304(-)